MNLFTNNTFQALERGLNGSTLRQQAISQNIANVDTPNYKARQVNFKHTLDEALNNRILSANRTDARHHEFSSANSGPRISINKNTMYNHNGNNVDIDHEMSELAKNQIYYNALIDRMNGRFTSLQTAIKGGR
ncbi:flagellar basal body rod protein FlgB [Bacillus sp. FJAT-45350]|uniref:flagellar basal body rod protein FlgB n=1 Tax=Bacillus sp. FJAT-45350 TaxID=2011014 RepID=UPI000BB8A456|nr:flagellar basal body rod protein FlgB [Bacillus sp. FJAT-45350]